MVMNINPILNIFQNMFLKIINVFTFEISIHEFSKKCIYEQPEHFMLLSTPFILIKKTSH